MYGNAGIVIIATIIIGLGTIEDVEAIIYLL
jgi:hypothetical protein